MCVCACCLASIYLQLPSFPMTSDPWLLPLWILKHNSAVLRLPQTSRPTQDERGGVQGGSDAEKCYSRKHRQSWRGKEGREGGGVILAAGSSFGVCAEFPPLPCCYCDTDWVYPRSLNAPRALFDRPSLSLQMHLSTVRSGR